MTVEVYGLTKGMHPLTGQPRHVHAQQPRMELHSMRQPARQISATYDAARTSDEFKNYWANADTLDADSAHSPAVRQKLVARSRYEVGSNGFADGMVQTHANYLVGTGPTLRMQSESRAFNRYVEERYAAWCSASLFRRKLWCMAHAKVQDGEPFGIIRNNPKIRHEVKLDVVLVETEQCQSPQLAFNTDGYIDGIKFDQFGNPEWYDVLKYHPGSNSGWSVTTEPERIPADFVLHWFTLRRPGQHRGIPEFRSTLNVGASSRRMREATVGAVETAASMGAALLKTTHAPDEMDAVSPMSTLDIQKRMMTALPMGWDAMQMKAEHPNATYKDFLRSQINEQARPKSIPYNLAACDSSSYNYASGRLDHQTYFTALDVERADANDLVLDPLFRLWFEELILAIVGSDDEEIPAEVLTAAVRYLQSRKVPWHCWDWPKHPVADEKSEADADHVKLGNGSTTLREVWAKSGRDYDDGIEQMAQDYGVSVEEMKRILRIKIFSNGNEPPSEQPQTEEVANVDSE